LTNKFSGPWSLRIRNLPGSFKVTLIGTDHTDGAYMGEHELSVAGLEWTLDVERLTGDPDNPWEPVEMEEAHGYDATEGLIIELTEPNHCDLLLVCLDQEINPPPRPPFDFTFPGG
jgi:hypothetical protein